MEPLHEVTREELPTLLQWLSRHLPDTFKLHGTVEAEVEGEWKGPTFYTLGWPDILAVGEGPVDESKCKSAAFYNHTRHTCVYAPKPEHVEQLLLSPDFLDWTRPIVFHAVPFDSANVVEKVSKATGTPHKVRYSCNLLAAYPGEVAVRPFPDEFEIRPLTPDDAEYITSTWAFARAHTVPYIADLVKTFPSIGAFNRNGECVALELGTEYGLSALLYTREDVRGRGLASCVVSHLAQKYFEQNKPILATVVSFNKAAFDLHTKLGFKQIGRICWYVHSMAGEKVFQCQQ